MKKSTNKPLTEGKTVQAPKSRTNKSPVKNPPAPKRKRKKAEAPVEVPPKKEVIKYYFEEDQLKKLYRLADNFSMKRSNRNRYKLWEYIHKCIPVLIPTKDYTLNTESIFKPYICEQ
jgi:hypothetical protein